jgi:Secretion system C-terminal sorting domain/Periplasmic copper-binding protein (NosD)
LILLFGLMLIASTAQAFTYSCLQKDCGGLCYKFVSNYPPGTHLTWDFGDGTTLETGAESVEHCYTNVNTYTNVNLLATVALSVLNQPTQYQTLNHASCQQGVFIGAVDEMTVTKLTDYSALPGSLWDGQGNTRDVYVYATVDVDKQFTFRATDIFMGASGGLNVAYDPFSYYGVLTLENNTKIDVPTGCSCLWRGIDVRGKFISRTNTTLKNALYAVRLLENPRTPLIDIRETNFINNYIGLMSVNMPCPLYTGNVFSTNAQLLNWCGGGDNVPDPFGPSQGLYYTDRGWAGIYLQGVPFFNIYSTLPSTPQNDFSTLANGIFMVNSNAGKKVGTILKGGVILSQFNQIRRGSYPVSMGGYGVYFLDAEGSHFLSQVGLGQLDAGNPTFTECEVGLYAEAQIPGGSTTIASNDNRMEQMETGYVIQAKLGTVGAGITENFIQANQEYGHESFTGGVHMEISFQTPGIAVDGNIITVNQPSSFADGVFIRGNNPDAPSSGTISVSGNQITLESGIFGITMSNVSGAIVQGNTLSVDGVFPAPDGIFMPDGSDNAILCNDVYGPPVPNSDSPLRYGILTYGSVDAVIRDNHVTNFDIGFSFGFPCGTDVDFACNDILGNNVRGLYYTANAVTGAQADKGNVWNCNSTEWEARNDNPNYLLDYYLAQMGTPQFPDSWTPSNWFQNSTDPPQSCPVDPNCGLMLTGPEVNPSDIAIANGTLSGPAGMVYSAEKILYRKLKDHPELLDNDSLMQAFVQARENTPTGEFYALAQSAPSLFYVDSLTQAQLNGNMDTLHADLVQIEIIDSLLAAGGPFTTLLQQRTELAQDANDRIAANAAIYDSLHNARLMSANDLLATNAAISTTAIYEQNEKLLYEVFLNTIGKDSSQATQAQLDTLQNIAAQCPGEGGDAVLAAIALHGSLTGSYLPIQDCLGLREGENAKENAGIEFILYPNPTSGSCQISCSIQDKKAIYEIVVFDLLGNKIAVHKLSAGSNEIRLDDLPSGIYLVQLFQNEHPIQTEKLIKL